METASDILKAMLREYQAFKEAEQLNSTKSEKDSQDSAPDEDSDAVDDSLDTPPSS
ncbi:MAG: hypothetical protein KME18_18130 [Phormidium tanganyikae FI6-MK23]|jgi:hypothetical protein|nr:hypothetical protein [Phormidium tanganyikae FI6-MK23]